MPPKKLKEGASPKKPRYDTSPGNPDGYRPLSEWSTVETQILVRSVARIMLENRSVLYTEAALHPWTFNGGDSINAKVKQVLAKLCKEYEVEMPTACTTTRTPKKRGAATEIKEGSAVSLEKEEDPNRDEIETKIEAAPLKKKAKFCKGGVAQFVLASHTLEKPSEAHTSEVDEAAVSPKQHTESSAQSFERDVSIDSASKSLSPGSSEEEEGAEALLSRSGRPQRRCAKDKNYALHEKMEDLDEYLRSQDAESDGDSGDQREEKGDAPAGGVDGVDGEDGEDAMQKTILGIDKAPIVIAV